VTTCSDGTTGSEGTACRAVREPALVNIQWIAASRHHGLPRKLVTPVDRRRYPYESEKRRYQPTAKRMTSSSNCRRLPA